MIPRLLLLLLAGCGTSTPATFACGDAGATCTTATEFCDIVTKGGATPTVTSSCKAFPVNCTFCACLIDSGAVNACSGSFGSATCTPKDDGTYTVTESCQ
jgi:hypothetical protein